MNAAGTWDSDTLRTPGLPYLEVQLNPPVAEARAARGNLVRAARPTTITVRTGPAGHPVTVADPAALRDMAALLSVAADRLAAS